MQALAVLGAAAVAAAAPTVHRPARRQQTTSFTCADIAEALTTSGQYVIPSAAHDCLQSVPNKKEPALKLVESIKAYSQFQSSHAWLKAPPEGYDFAATDILSTLDSIASKVSSGGYASEYDFQLDIYTTIASAHDGHYTFLGDVFRAFTFSNDDVSDIISVSADGVSAPKLYHLRKLLSRITGCHLEPTFGQRS